MLTFYVIWDSDKLLLESKAQKANRKRSVKLYILIIIKETNN